MNYTVIWVMNSSGSIELIINIDCYVTNQSSRTVSTYKKSNKIALCTALKNRYIEKCTNKRDNCNISQNFRENCRFHGKPSTLRSASSSPHNCNKTNKKLIRRWDSERELALRRHCTHTRKCNRLLHKFRHRSFSATQVYQIQWNNAM